MDDISGQNDIRAGIPAGGRGAPKGAIAVIVAGCMWGSVGVFVRIFTGYGYSPLTIVFVRMLLAFAITLVMLLVSGRKSFLRVKPKDLWCFIGAGGSSAILLNLFFSMSTLINSLSLAAILLSTSPIFVVLLSRPIFKERITAEKAQALCIAFAGCVLTSGIVGSGSAFSLKGVSIGLLAGVGYSLYSIMSRFALNRGYEPLTVNIYSFGIATLFCAPFANFSVIAATVADAPGRMIALLVVHTLCASFFPYMFFTYGMKFMDTGKASILVSIEPVAALFFGLGIYGEIPAAISVAGIVLVLFGLVLLNVPGGLRALPGILKAPFRVKA